MAKLPLQLNECSECSFGKSLSLSTLSSDESEKLLKLEEAVNVNLNFYSLPELNKKINSLKLGIYHVGIELYQKEWSYGYHRLAESGLYEYKPRDAKSLSNKTNMFRFVRSMVIGKTRHSLQKVIKRLNELGSTNYLGIKYHIIYKNCFDFVTLFGQILCERMPIIPEHFNRLQYIHLKHPEIISMIPDDYRTPDPLKELLRSKISIKTNHFH